jgi:hypothetical protein
MTWRRSPGATSRIESSEPGAGTTFGVCEGTVVRTLMNAAGALARSLLPDGSLDQDRLTDLLADLDVQWQWLLTEDPERVERLVTTSFLALFGPQSLGALRESGRAGLVQLTEQEFERALAGTPVAPTRRSGRWMEFARLPEEGWVAYPQDKSPGARLAVWLPVASGPGTTRFVALDIGLDVMTGEVESPFVSSNGCDPGFEGEGQELRQVCLPGQCPHPCREHWQYREGELVLVSCSC